jgi:hypothetical protein
MVDEAVRQRQRAELQALVEQPGMRQVLHDQRAEAADAAFLDGQQHLVLARQALHQPGVQRLGEARIGDRGGKAMRRQLVRRPQAFLQARAVGEDRDGVAFPQHAPLAERQHRAALRQLDAEPLAARIAEGGRAVVAGGRGRHHVHQLRLVGRGH